MTIEAAGAGVGVAPTAPAAPEVVRRRLRNQITFVVDDQTHLALLALAASGGGLSEVVRRLVTAGLGLAEPTGEHRVVAPLDPSE